MKSVVGFRFSSWYNIYDFSSFEFKRSPVLCSLKQLIIYQTGDILGLSKTLHNHGIEFRPLISFNEYELRPSDFSFDFLFFKDELFDARA